MSKLQMSLWDRKECANITPMRPGHLNLETAVDSREKTQKAQK
jgi:hypothetical protein